MTMKQYNRKCPICGREFVTDSIHRNVFCSPECVRIRHEQWAKEYYSRNDVKAKKKAYKRNYIREKSKCILCGKPMYHSFENGDCKTTMHDKCVFVDCLNTLNTGGVLNNAQRQRLVSRGYGLKEFKREFREYLLDSPILNENEREQGCNAYDVKLLLDGDTLADEAYRAINEGVKNND